VDALPDAVTEWVRDAVGSDARAIHAHEMSGATTSVVAAIDVDRAHDATVHLVLRRYVDHAVLDSEPDAVAREVAVLGALEASTVDAPRVVAADPDGAICGDPMLLMTRLHGKPRWLARQGVVDFLDQLAAQLPAVHEVTPADPEFPTYRAYYEDDDQAPPTWSAHADAWTDAIEAHAAPPPSYTPVLIHRDYHPGNVLWNGNTVSGIVDWAWGCCGPAEVDVAHCRLNLALRIDADAADLFLSAWETHAGVYSYDTTWDLRDAVDALPDLKNSQAALERLDEFVARSAAKR
jgi:aminoglycoside phosphotransferase (APT) family kinase protein